MRSWTRRRSTVGCLQFGYWSVPDKSPGPGGADRTCTDAGNTNDNNIVDTGASTTDYSRDGGLEVKPQFTGDGAYGLGGLPSNGNQYGIYNNPNTILYDSMLGMPITGDLAQRWLREWLFHW